MYLRVITILKLAVISIVFLIAVSECEKRPCIHKCCPLGLALLPHEKEDARELNKFDCEKYDIPFQIKNIDKYEIIYNFKCPHGKVPVWVLGDEFDFSENGELILPVDNETTIIKSPIEYCVNYTNGSTIISVVLCIEKEPEQAAYIGMIISMPFLFITFLVYLILPERNVHRRALINYVFSLLCGYISLVTVQLFRNDTAPLGDIQCHTIGYSIVFFFIVSFFWMNVMCIDMWLAFSGLRGFGGRRNAEKKKFIMFCLYAWGMPALLILLIYLMNTFADTKAIYHPKLGFARCFLEEGYPNLFYFYLPMAILITVNVILCILTAVKIQKVKKETSMLKHSDSQRHSYENDKQKFKLYLKLIFAMGINWSMEVVSWLILWQWHDLPSYIWYLTDFTNAAYGVFIFFIFVFKKNVWVQLKKRYYVWRGQPHLAHSLSSTQATRTSNFSTADIVTVSNDYKLNDLRNGKLEEKPLNSFK